MHSMSLLVEDWVSRAAALQRRGRAGRVRAGACLCCYTRARFESGLRQYAVPEVARVPLEELVLQVLCVCGRVCACVCVCACMGGGCLRGCVHGAAVWLAGSSCRCTRTWRGVRVSLNP
jgi:hypothetical protein